MKQHILGICGTFMAGVALLAKEKGYTVQGADEHVYPPMSTQLETSGIKLFSGYDPQNITPDIENIIVGNAMKRGNPSVEHLLNEHLPYISGPQWVAEHILRDRIVLAVAGTHGKTTTASLLAWILEFAGLAPGFLIGGMPKNFGVSARLGQGKYFVIEADEYDTAFFDKRSKFIHYHPEVLLINNLEFDHADIFPNLEAIVQQFQFLLRTIPGNGTVITPSGVPVIEELLSRGCWSQQVQFGGANAAWQAIDASQDASRFTICHNKSQRYFALSNLIGQHNLQNALGAIAAANAVGVKPEVAVAALAEFQSVKRRLEQIGLVNNISVYDDFAHHPTAIEATLNSLRNKVGSERILAVLECKSYTMRQGHHKEQLARVLGSANEVLLARPAQDWGIEEVAQALQNPSGVYETGDEIIAALCRVAKPRDHILIMSNGGFSGLYDKLLQSLAQAQGVS